MTPLAPPLASGEFRLWRIDLKRHASTWQTGEGAFRVGGRWNPPGVRAVCASLDPATAALEVALHKRFRVLDTLHHVLTSAVITDPERIHVVPPDEVPNPNWLMPITSGRNQQVFGAELLRSNGVVLIPSAVTRHSWNLIFEADALDELLRDVDQERFALDPRLQG
ncbi:RES family NAD+ phosphorylase [Roseivivax sp. CAU 1761]